MRTEQHGEAIPLEARGEILRRLDAIARDNSVRILLAVESGSRAWGFHSPDSDFDVRFLYVRAEETYLALWQPRDLIETPLVDVYDVNGWDLGKALRLMIKGNSVVHEWLVSPHVYRADAAFIEALTPIARAWRNAYADAHHYHGLLATQRARFIAGRSEVNLKKYFYALRPALALQWLRERTDPPPMELTKLLAGLSLPPAFSSALEALREAKRAASEVGRGPPVPALDEYIEEQARWGLAAKGRAPTPDPELLERSNQLFRAAVRDQLR